MNTPLNRISVVTVALAFFASACMMNDSEDIPDFYEQLQSDLATIDAYLDEHNIDAQQDPDGLIRYVIHEDSVGGVRPTLDSCVTATYKGILMAGGTSFDSGTASFPLSAVIDGWKIGMPLLNEGDSATIYVPSGLGYGYYGYEPRIPRNANLIFHVRLKNVGSTYNSSARSCN